MEKKTIKELKKGEFFTRKPIDGPNETQVWIRGDYDRAAKKYECTRFDDFCRTMLFKPTAQVYTEFTF